MPYKVIRAEAVKEDVQKALNFYDSASFEVGLRFENEIQLAFRKLGASPYNYFNLRNGYRRVAFDKFPYMLVYRIEEDINVVKVFGLFHQHSNPKSMYKKIKTR
jgi:hypothetical protein